MTSLVIYGAGRMAQAVAAAARECGDVETAAIVSRQPAEWAGEIPNFQSLDQLPARPDALIDFTLPAGTVTAAQWCGRNGVALVSGVTGLQDEARHALHEAARQVPVLWGANLSIGVNLLAELARSAATVLSKDAPVHVEDIHHQWKKDAPSGTALMLGGVIAGVRGGDSSRISYDSTREGEVIGEHSLTFSLAGEDIVLSHRAHNRDIYASGAVAAAKWLISQSAGLYTTADWLAGYSGNES